MLFSIYLSYNISLRLSLPGIELYPTFSYTHKCLKVIKLFKITAFTDNTQKSPLTVANEVHHSTPWQGRCISQVDQDAAAQPLSP